MNFGELKDTLISYSHRPDLMASVPGFVAMAEGMIRRDLRLMPQKVTLTEADRISNGLYALPSDVAVRTVYTSDAPAGATHVGAKEIRQLPDNAPVLRYTVSGETIEFRGIPATDATIEVHYHGHPVALVNDEDTNDLLTKHRTIYIFGSLFALYQMTQDLELADAALGTYQSAIDQLNAQVSRNLGGAQVSLNDYYFGPLPGGY